jgi:uncharacterized protein (DUF302 family)
MLSRIVAVISLLLLMGVSYGFFKGLIPTEKAFSFSIDQTVTRVALEEGVSPDDAIESMKLRANDLNMKLVAHMPLSTELIAQGVENVRRIEIFQFCDAKIAKAMVDHDMNFGAYLPCRITLMEDADGKLWLVMMKIDLFISMAHLPDDILALAKKVNDSLNSIIQAGASGAL